MLGGCDITNARSVQGVLQAVSSWNDKVQGLLFSPNRLAPTYTEAEVLKPPRFNAFYEVEDVRPVDAGTWRLELAGRVGDKRPWTARQIAELPEPERAMAGRVHAIITASAPVLAPRTWYGMPAYAKDGKIVCFFQSAQKFNTRYATLGFNDTANLDEGAMWPTAFALTEWTPAVQDRIAELVKKAVS